METTKERIQSPAALEQKGGGKEKKRISVRVWWAAAGLYPILDCLLINFLFHRDDNSYRSSLRQISLITLVNFPCFP
uniref:Uncharacterized protein n=1 Tax=Arundo donax TaxID=35708 RepID=A0A0A9CTG1_ARUDO